ATPPACAPAAGAARDTTVATATAAHVAAPKMNRPARNRTSGYPIDLKDARSAAAAVATWRNEAGTPHKSYPPAAMKVAFIALLFVIGLTAVGARAAANDASRRPNVVIIMTDDQGFGDLACNGNPVVRTPNIDKLSKDGVRLTNFYVCPVCSPTRASLMT